MEFLCPTIPPNHTLNDSLGDSLWVFRGFPVHIDIITQSHFMPQAQSISKPATTSGSPPHRQESGIVPVRKPVRSAVFLFLFVLLTFVQGVLTFPVLFLPHKFVYINARLWARMSIGLFCRLLGATVEVRGREHLPKGPYLICSKHQSALETLVMAYTALDVAFVLKRELVWIPIFGWYMYRLRMPAIDRSAGTSALRRMLAQARREAERGRPILIFPEGTRTPPGKRGVWHGGAAMLAQALNLPIVPVALNSGVAWPKGDWVKSSGRIIFEFLPPLKGASDGSPLPSVKSRELLNQLADVIEPASRRLEEEAGFSAQHIPQTTA